MKAGQLHNTLTDNVNLDLFYIIMTAHVMTVTTSKKTRVLLCLKLKLPLRQPLYDLPLYYSRHITFIVVLQLLYDVHCYITAVICVDALSSAIV